MTTPASTGKKSFLGKYLLYKLYTHKGLLTASVVCNLLIMPLLCGAVLFSIDYIGGIKAATMYEANSAGQLDAMLYVDFVAALIAGVAALILLVISFILPSRLFRYNNDSHSTDMYLSLPLSSTERFFGDFSAGLCITAVPLTLGIGVGLPMLSAVKNALFSLPKEHLIYSMFGNTASFESFCEDALNLAGIMMFCLCLSVVFIYISGVFMSVCCGGLADGMIFAFVLNILPPAVASVIVSLIFVNVCGVAYSTELCNILGFIPPVGTVISVFSRTIDSIDSIDEVPALSALISPALIITLILITAALSAGAYLLSRRRKAEQTEKPFAFDIFYHILSLVTVCCIAAFFVLSAQNTYDNTAAIYTAMIIICAAVYLLTEVAHRRGFSKIWQSGIRFAAAMIFSCFILPLVTCSVGLAIETYVPDRSEIESVTVSGGLLDSRVIVGGASVHDKRLCYTDSGDIEKIVQLHESFIGERRPTAESEIESGAFSIKYRLKNGGEVSRLYRIDYNDIDGVRDMLRSTAQYDELMYGYIDREEIIAGEAWFYAVDSGFDRIQLDAGKLPQLISAIRADVKEGGFNSGEIKARLWLMTVTGSENGNIREDSSVYVTENCKNTLSFIYGKENTQSVNAAEGVSFFLHDVPIVISDESGSTEEHINQIEVELKELTEQELAELFSMIKISTNENADDIAITATNFYDCNIQYYIDGYNSARARELLTRLVKENSARW